MPFVSKKGMATFWRHVVGLHDPPRNICNLSSLPRGVTELEGDDEEDGDSKAAIVDINFIIQELDG